MVSPLADAVDDEDDGPGGGMMIPVAVPTHKIEYKKRGHVPLFFMLVNFYIFFYIVFGLTHRIQLNIRSSHSVFDFRLPNRQGLLKMTPLVQLIAS